MGGAVARELGAMKARAQARELMFDLLWAFREGGGERRLEALEFGAQVGECLVDRCFGLGKDARLLCAQVFFDDARFDVLVTGEEVWQLQTVTHERAGGRSEE